jgi:pimeloyl-ACP methyl ester carboxylesterase
MKASSRIRSRRMTRLLSVALYTALLVVAFDDQAQNMATSEYIRQSNNDSVIIFVHGVLGDSRDTWTNTSTNAYWPSLMKNDPYFNGFDIFVVDYPSDFLQSSYTVDELVEVMRRDFDSAGIFAKYKYVYFLCHSMGGLVVRGFLTRFQKRASQVPMIYFFSTPTTGAEIANLARLLSRNRQMSGLLPINANEYLASVQKGWLAAQFQIASYCAYETLDTRGVRIVDEGSATNLCNRSPDAINANHIDIVKPRDIKDVPYIAFENAIRDTRPAPTKSHVPRQEKSEKPDRTQSLPILSTQLEQLRELEKLFAGKNEVDLNTQFDITGLESVNIRMIRDRIIHVRTTGDKTNFDLTPYSDGGGFLVAADIAGDTLSHTPSGGVFRPDFSRVSMIVLTTKYSNALKQLNFYEDSVTIPTDVILAIKDLDTTVQKKARTLLDTLDSCLQENPEYFMDGLMPPMGIIHQRFNHLGVELRPKVNTILDASRKYLRADSANP